MRSTNFTILLVLGVPLFAHNARADLSRSPTGLPAIFNLYAPPSAPPSAAGPVTRPPLTPPAMPPLTQPAMPPAIPAPARMTTGSGDPGAQCVAAVRAAGRAAGIPGALMNAIARIESGRADGNGGVSPWPWSINVEGVDHVYATKDEAIAAVTAFEARGMRSIDVGCMQVNLLWHADAFPNLEAAFDPATNAAYAAKFLTQLFNASGSWERATAMYHSANPELGGPYQRKVAAILPEEERRATAGGMMPGAAMPSPASAIPSTQGAIAFDDHAATARLLPAPNGTMTRGLDAYRATPITVISRLAMRAPP